MPSPPITILLIGNVLLAETPIGHGQTAEQTEANAPIAPTVLY